MASYAGMSKDRDLTEPGSELPDETHGLHPHSVPDGVEKTVENWNDTGVFEDTTETNTQES